MGSLNYVQLDVVNRAAGTTVDFNNVTLNGQALGDFSGAGWSTWMVTGIDFTSGFTIEGDIVLTGPQPSGETNKVEIKVGYSIPLEITTTSLPSGIVLTPYSETIATNGGIQPFTWSVSSGALPDGLTLNDTTGEISGTPTLSGTFDFTVQVVDAVSATALKNLSITTESLPVRYGDPGGGGTNYTDIIQSAYDACVDGYIIQVQATTLSEDVVCDRAVTITIQGGFDEYYTSNNGITTVTGNLILNDGKVVIENIVLQ
jgi:hypothetical protein